jgi:hypothetical protein
MIALFKKQAIEPPEQMAVGVQKFRLEFPLWKGEPIPRTHGSKPVIDHDGKGTFAELALISILRQNGFDGAVWVDNWQGCHFRDATPTTVCDDMPNNVLEKYKRIVKRNGGRGGCWDVMAWNNEGVAFVECKLKDCKLNDRKYDDHISQNQIKWLESALNEGIPLERFAICEWTIAAS